jgi:hypothetical protein
MRRLAERLNQINDATITKISNDDQPLKGRAT